MNRGVRWGVLAGAATVFAGLGWYLAVFTLGTGALAWLALLALPAVLAAGTAAVVRGTLGEIICTGVLASALSASALVAVIVWAASEGAFQ